MSEDPGNAAENKSINKDVIEAVNLLAHGKRNILCGEISQAVTQLQEACRILGVEYGELADECADAYLWYGKALLELSRLESGVLGDAIPGAESEESESSADDSSDEQNSVTEDNGAEDEMEDGVMSEDLEEEEAKETADETTTKPDDKNINGTKATGEVKVPSPAKAEDVSSAKEVASSSKNDKDLVGDGDAGSNVEEGGKVPASSAAGENSSAAVPGTSKSEDTDDISNLQLAWEMLELSKLIYKRHDRNEMKLKLAETYLRLGEIGMETEQYDQAISDLTQCLQIQKQILVPEDRRLAETLYQLGLACTYCRHYDSAVEYYRSAIAVIQSKIDRLVRIVTGEIPPDPVENGDGFYTPLELAQKEIEELRELLPDIAAKIDDVRDEQGEADKVKVMMRESLTPPGPVGTSTSSQTPDGSGDAASTSNVFKVLPSTSSVQPVNNISHLVRKKRKSEDDQKLKSDLPKRQKTSDAAATSSGTSKTASAENQAPGGKADPKSLLETGDTGSKTALNNQEFQPSRQADV